MVQLAASMSAKARLGGGDRHFEPGGSSSPVCTPDSFDACRQSPATAWSRASEGHLPFVCPMTRPGNVWQGGGRANNECMLLFNVLLQIVLTRFDEAQEWVMELDDSPLFAQERAAQNMDWASAS